MVNFWKLSYETVKEQRDKLTDDIEVLKANISRLEDEISQSDYVKASVLGDREEYKNKIIELIKENEKLKKEIKRLKGED